MSSETNSKIKWNNNAVYYIEISSSFHVIVRLIGLNVIFCHLKYAGWLLIMKVSDLAYYKCFSFGECR